MSVIRLAARVVEQRRSGARLAAVREPSAHDPAEERQLVQSAASGSLQAWCTLVARHAPAVWAWAVDWTDGEDAAALVSEVVWLRLAQSLLDLDGCSVADWLYAQVADEVGRQRAGESGGVRRLRLMAEE